MGFSVPKESATHIHFDAKPLLSARVTANLVCFLHTYGDILKRLIGCNPLCRRLGNWPKSLLQIVCRPDFKSLPWEKARLLLIDCHLKKYCDFNIKNYVLNLKNKSTFEVRVLPGMMEVDKVLQAISLFEGVLNHCIADLEIPFLEPMSWHLKRVDTMLSELPLRTESRAFWSHCAQSR